MSQPHASPALSSYTSSTASPLLNEKSKSSFQDPIYTPIPTPSSPAFAHHTRIKHLQHYDNLIGYILSLLSVSLTSIMDGLMVYVLYKFYTTRDITAPGRISPWAKNTKLWPAFMLLIASFVTLCIDTAALIAACISHRARKHAHSSTEAQNVQRRSMRVEGMFNRLGYVVFVGKWIVVFILYRVGKTSKDLWGWSCDERARKIQQYYVLQLDFDKLCTEQTVAWYLSISEMAIKVLLAVTGFWLARMVKKMNHGGIV